MAAITRMEALRRLQELQDAVNDEHGRFNRAVASGKKVYLNEFVGPHHVESVSPSWDYYTPTANGGLGMHWAGCNNYDWARMMAEVGEPRNRLFTK